MVKILEYDLRIVSNSEQKKIFSSCLAGGFCGRTLIKLFIAPNCSDCEDCTLEILSHEILHFVLGKVVGVDAKQKLDYIHKSFYVYDFAIKKWTFVVEFVHEKGRPITIL